ncbi:MAG TPA: phosphoribosylglycinamide synthetase C domain-containing protein, partial [Acidiphilium sp.]|nr:phosphoribosylglycinamide synthetase C domain-containing protein [Acidiphilium sp.]
VSAGGRVLAVTATGDDLREAIDRAYVAVRRIDFPGGFCRRDIGAKAV